MAEQSRDAVRGPEKSSAGGETAGTEYDPFLGLERRKHDQDCPDETVLISVADFYDLLMEQQEQMKD